VTFFDWTCKFDASIDRCLLSIDPIMIGSSHDIWMMRFIVINGHAVYAAWLLIASCLNLTIWLKTKLTLNSQGWATTFSLIIVTIGILIYWILENFVFPSIMAYTWSPWLVWFIALAGILVEHGRSIREKSLNSLLILMLTVLCFVLFCVRIVLFVVRYTREEIPTRTNPAGL
jgi:hypothetical protein